MVLTPILVEQGVREDSLSLSLSLRLSLPLSLPPTHIVHNMSVSVTFSSFLATPLFPSALLTTKSIHFTPSPHPTP